MKLHRGSPYGPRRREWCSVGDGVTDKGLGVGTEMPFDGDGTMVGDKLTIGLAPSAQTEG
jgi:hypothetical protein